MATQYSGSWRKCEITTNPEVTYSLEASNSNIAIKDDAKGIASVIGTTPLPMDKVVSWKLNILKSEGKDGGGLYLGAAYEGIAMDDYGICDAGFFIRPFTAQLWSGAPFNYMNREYGPKKTPGTYVHDGDTIEVIMDMKNGELSYVVNGENFGVAYKNIPTWMPLYPCARIENAGTTIGLNLPEEVIIKYQNPTEKFVSEWVACPTSMFGSVSKYKDGNHKIIYKGDQRTDCTVITKDALPAGKIVSWNIRPSSGSYAGAKGIYIGVAPKTILTGSYRNYDSCGWYLSCYGQSLRSGAPHKYRGKAYGPRKERLGEYVKNGDIVTVVMDTAKGNLSFIVGGVDLGIAFEGIPLDKPLVPCVIMEGLLDKAEIC